MLALYEITALAGTWVAGVEVAKVPASAGGKRFLTLSTLAAEAELRIGSLVLAGEQPPEILPGQPGELRLSDTIRVQTVSGVRDVPLLELVQRLPFTREDRAAAAQSADQANAAAAVAEARLREFGQRADEAEAAVTKALAVAQEATGAAAAAILQANQAKAAATSAAQQALDAAASAAVLRSISKADSGANSDITDLLGVDGQGVRLRASSTTLASAATIDLGAAPTLKVSISGTARITSLGTSANAIALLRFADAATLVHDATSLVLPGGADIVATVGDTAIATSDASGAWTVRAYQRASGLPLGVRRSQLLQAVSSTLPGGLAALLDSGLVSPEPDAASNLAFYHEPFALPGGTLAGILEAYCRNVLGRNALDSAALVTALFAAAATLSSGT